ncbi:MAG: thiosulfate sulfurtransferase [Gammaproteobacteria bacterium]|nr:thiosulfate sulfurtransferase [Gammaproteobacteria bacterium]
MGSYKNISIEEAKKILSSDIYLLDIRDHESFDTSHIDGAVHLSNDNIDDFLTNADKTKPTIIYCYKGVSSKDAAQHFCDIGFNDVYSMQGGYGLWVDSDEKA